MGCMAWQNGTGAARKLRTRHGQRCPPPQRRHGSTQGQQTWFGPLCLPPPLKPPPPHPYTCLWSVARGVTASGGEGEGRVMSEKVCGGRVPAGWPRPSCRSSWQVDDDGSVGRPRYKRRQHHGIHNTALRHCFAPDNHAHNPTLCSDSTAPAHPLHGCPGRPARQEHPGGDLEERAQRRRGTSWCPTCMHLDPEPHRQGMLARAAVQAGVMCLR